MNIVELNQALKAVCPIDGVSVGQVADKSTWRIDFKPEATTEQRAAAQGVVDVFSTGQSAEEARQAAVDAAIAGDATIASLKAMTNAEFDTWWAANVTNAAQAIGVLKRVTRVVLRRVL